MASEFDQFDDLLVDDEVSSPDPSDFESIDSANLMSDEEPSNDESTNNVDEGSGEKPDYSDNGLYQYLQSRGISDPSKIKFTNEDGSEEDVDFSSLSGEDQKDLLDSIADPGLTPDELNAINYFRQNGINFQQAMDGYAQQVLNEYLANNPQVAPQREYSVDDYSDDELFLADLKSRFPDLSDDDLLSELDTAKVNEELFNKKASALRTLYKEREDQIAAEEQAAIEQQSIDLRNSINDTLYGFNEIVLDRDDVNGESLVIEDSDKQQIMSYLFDRGTDGNSQFVRDCSDPGTLVELAWFRTQGPKVLSDLSQYWKGVLANERAEKKRLQSKLDKYEKTKPVTSKRESDPPHGVLSAWNNI